MATQPVIKIENLVSRSYPNGRDLHEFVDTVGPSLRKSRILYVVAPTMAIDRENSTERKTAYRWCKFGVAGMLSGVTLRPKINPAVDRLKWYVRVYGTEDENDPCAGVRIFYCAKVYFPKDIVPGGKKNNMIAKMETTLKRHYEKVFLETGEQLILPNRGEEIVAQQPSEVINVIRQYVQPGRTTKHAQKPRTPKKKNNRNRS